MRKSLRKAVRDKLKDFENEISFGQSVVPLPLVKGIYCTQTSQSESLSSRNYK